MLYITRNRRKVFFLSVMQNNIAPAFSVAKFPIIWHAMMFMRFFVNGGRVVTLTMCTGYGH